MGDGNTTEEAPGTDRYLLATTGLDRFPSSIFQKPTQKLISMFLSIDSSLDNLHFRLWEQCKMLSFQQYSQTPPGKALTPVSFSAKFLPYRRTDDSSTTWLTPLRRAPCLLSWCRSSGSCGRMEGCKPASTELQSTSSMTRHLSKTAWGRGGMKRTPHPRRMCTQPKSPGAESCRPQD